MPVSAPLTPALLKPLFEADFSDRREEERAASVVRIVDDDEDVRGGLKKMLEIEGFRVADWPSADAFLADPEEAREERPGCLVLDVRMPGMSGLELQNRLHELGRGLPVIFLTGFADVHVAVSSLKAGALDFLMKPVDEDELIAAIDRALHRDRLRRLGTREERIAEGAETLSEHEVRILIFILKNLTDAQISERTGVSVRTVEGHRAKLYRKFNVHSGEALEAILPDIREALRKRFPDVAPRV